jgi:hypothetical protein
MSAGMMAQLFADALLMAIWRHAKPEVGIGRKRWRRSRVSDPQ